MVGPWKQFLYDILVARLGKWLKIKIGVDL